MLALFRDPSDIAFNHLLATFDSDMRKSRSSSSDGSMSAIDYEVYEKMYTTPYIADIRRNHGEAAYQEALAAQAYRAKMEQETEAINARRWSVCEEKNKTEKCRAKRIARRFWCLLKETCTNPSYL